MDKLEKSYQALGNTIMVVAPSVKKTDGWLLVKQWFDEKTKTAEGVVYGIGDGNEVSKLDLKAWDVVIYKKFLPDPFYTEIDWERQRIEMCEVQHILAKVN